MSKKKIHWHKITANALVVFFSTLGASFTMDSLLDLVGIPTWYFLGIALIVSGIQFALSFCQAWAKAEEEENHIKVSSLSNTPTALYKKWKKRADLLSNLVLFD